MDSKLSAETFFKNRNSRLQQKGSNRNYNKYSTLSPINSTIQGHAYNTVEDARCSPGFKEKKNSIKQL